MRERMAADRSEGMRHSIVLMAGLAAGVRYDAKVHLAHYRIGLGGTLPVSARLVRVGSAGDDLGCEW